MIQLTLQIKENKVRVVKRELIERVDNYELGIIKEALNAASKTGFIGVKLRFSPFK